MVKQIKNIGREREAKLNKRHEKGDFWVSESADAMLEYVSAPSCDRHWRHAGCYKTDESLVLSRETSPNQQGWVLHMNRD